MKKYDRGPSVGSSDSAGRKTLKYATRSDAIADVASKFRPRGKVARRAARALAIRILKRKSMI